MKTKPKKKAKPSARVSTIFRIKVTLRHVAPPVWRRLEIPADTKLPRLHDILQMAMGWYDSHLHAFRLGRTSYGKSDPYFPDDMENERNVKLNQLVGEGEKLIYEYDFGDGWEHEIKVEKAFAPEPCAYYPRCTDGKRACPPEDCGGPYGYQRLLEILADPKHEEHEQMREWLGARVDAEEFDLDDINTGLRHVRK
jgi:hypothetical protein